MPCDRKLRAGQSITERKNEIRAAVEALSKALAAGRVKVKIGPRGSIAFDGISEADRNGVTDSCMYSRLMATGSALAKAAITKAELLSGTSISRQTVTTGLHSHDGGHSWHANHKH